MDGARALLLLAVVGARLLPRRVLDADAGICLFRRLTGRPCPACGLTRSWSAATRADVRESAAWHPLGIPAMLAALAVTALPRTALERPATRRWAAVAAVIWLSVWAVRFVRPPARLRR
jgi:hypothetical protein